MKRAVVLSGTLTLFIVSTLLSQEATRQGTRRAQRRQQVPSQQVFTLRGVEFTQAQQAEVEKLRKKYTPQLAEIQRKHGSIFTNEQRRAHREAFQAAREAGKQGRELREAVDAAVTLTDEQKEKLATIQKERADLFARIRREVRALLTDEQRRQLRPQGRTRRPVRPPTHRDVKYGRYERNVMDVWLAESDDPTPVLVSIHGGGFRGGNKSVSGDLLRQCLESGISVVATMDTPITSQGIGIHHPRFGKALKEKMDPLGIECHVHTGVRRGTQEWVTLTMDFVRKHLGLQLRVKKVETRPPGTKASMKGWEIHWG